MLQLLVILRRRLDCIFGFCFIPCRALPDIGVCEGIFRGTTVNGFQGVLWWGRCKDGLAGVLSSRFVGNTNYCSSAVFPLLSLLHLLGFFFPQSRDKGNAFNTPPLHPSPSFLLLLSLLLKCRLLDHTGK